MNIIAGVLLGMLMIATSAVLFGLPIMLLWDWLMPTIFGLPEITFWQAIGLNFLCGILFKANVNVKKD